MKMAQRLVFPLLAVLLLAPVAQAQNQTVTGSLTVNGETTLSGALNVSGAADFNHSVTNFGTNGADATKPGLVLTYTDTVSGTISTITLATSGTSAIWQWERNSANGLIPQMTLTATNSLILWNPTVSNSAGIILNPNGDSTFSGSITATGTNSRLPNQQISTDTASILTAGLADERYLQVGGSGATLVNVNASNITAGNLDDSRLSSNVSLLGSNETFTGNKTFSATTVMANLNAQTISGNSLTITTTNPESGLFLEKGQIILDMQYGERGFIGAFGGARSFGFSKPNRIFMGINYDTGNVIIAPPDIYRSAVEKLEVYGNAKINGNSIVSGTVTISGGLNVSGTATLSQLVISGTNSTHIVPQGDLSMGNFTSSQPTQ